MAAPVTASSSGAATIECGYDPRANPKQLRFHQSTARIRAYGGAVGGGKSRAICEEALRLMLDHPGVVGLICRQAHTSIIQTTKKTFTEQVLHPDLVAADKSSGGEDWIKLKNNSVVHFVGLEDPIRWFSSELGFVIFDEAHEINQETISKLITRLRQRCDDCVRDSVTECTHMPKKVIVAFNPDNPGHWLFKWFIEGASPTPWGFYKEFFRLPEATKSIGDAEFIKATVRDNAFVGKDYIEMLEGLPDLLRRRYLEGEWIYISGSCFFDLEALTWYQDQLKQPEWVGKVECCKQYPGCKCQGIGAKPRFRSEKSGEWAIWKPPTRERWRDGKRLPAHRYVVAVDVSSGGSTDYSAIQVLCVETWEQVAEYQGKYDPDQVAVQSARIASIYNQALVAVETTGGFGFSVTESLKRLKYGRLYTRRSWDRLAKKFTDAIGWDTTTKTRSILLDTLEQSLRDRSLILNGERTHHELASFVRDEAGRPAAQPGANDDLVVALAISVIVASQLPKQLRRVKEPEYTPQYATGW